jgi:hypothetical protein
MMIIMRMKPMKAMRMTSIMTMLRPDAEPRHSEQGDASWRSSRNAADAAADAVAESAVAAVNGAIMTTVLKRRMARQASRISTPHRRITLVEDDEFRDAAAHQASHDRYIARDPGRAATAASWSGPWRFRPGTRRS